MTNWKHHFDIKALLDEYEERQDPDSIKELANKIVLGLERELPEELLLDIDDVVEDLKDTVDTPEGLDACLTELYEWGDRVKVAFGYLPNFKKDQYVVPTSKDLELEEEEITNDEG